MKILATLIAAGAGAMIWTSASLAQAPTTTPETPASPPAASAPTHGHSALSIECSKQADAKGLHGKARKKFRDDCKHGKADAAQ